MMYSEIVASVCIDSSSCRQWYSLPENGGAQVEVFHKGCNVDSHGAQLGPKGWASHSTLRDT